MPDLPMYLEQQSLVDDYEAKKQEIEICLHQLYGTVLHNMRKGTALTMHIAQPAKARRLIEETLRNIENVYNVSVDASKYGQYGYVEIHYTYRNKEQNIVFYVDR